MKIYDRQKTCDKHGKTLFKHKKNKKGEWWVCHQCLKIQWKKAQLKRREKSEVREYQKEFNKNKTKIIKSLSLTLKIILLACFIKPK